LARLQNFDDRGMIKALPDLFLAQKAFVKDDVALVLQVRYFEDDGLPGLTIDPAKDRRHAATGDDVANLVLVECLAGGKLVHRAGTLAGQTGRGQGHGCQRPRCHQRRAAGGGVETTAATCTLKLSSPPASRPRSIRLRQAASAFAARRCLMI